MCLCGTDTGADAQPKGVGLQRLGGPSQESPEPLDVTQHSWLLARCEWAELAGPAIPLRPVSSLERGHLIPEIQQGGFIETVPLKRAQNDGYRMFLNSSWSF